MSNTSLLFIWLDKRLGSLPGGNDRIKEKFRQLFNPLKQFDKPTSCEDSIEQIYKDKKIFFLTSSSFADERFLKKISSFNQIIRIYLFDPTNSIEMMKFTDEQLTMKMGSQRQIQFDENLYEQILFDLTEFYSNNSIQYEKQRNVSLAKENLQLALKYSDLAEEKDEQFNDLQQNINERLQKLV